MISVPSGVRVWLATGHTDMRKGFATLYRQSERYRREGIDLSVSTLADQVGATAARSADHVAAPPAPAATGLQRLIPARYCHDRFLHAF